jgi:hypothetical protein
MGNISSIHDIWVCEKASHPQQHRKPPAISSMTSSTVWPLGNTSTKGPSPVSDEKNGHNAKSKEESMAF